MAGNTSAIQMASNALVLLGHPPISSFNEPGAGARASSNLYESTYRDVLSGTRWRFATKKANLSRFSSAPLNEYKYQYQLPSDFLYVIRVIDNSDYEIYQDRLYSDIPALSIDYIYRVDESYLPPYFAVLMEYQLAAKLAIPVTANSTRAALYDDMATRQLKKARYLDSSQRPADEVVGSIYVDARH